MKNQKTLKELQHLLDTQDDFYNYIAYNEESSNDEDLFSEQDFINPENNQNKIMGWLPIEEENYNLAMIATTVTTQNHNWTSDLVFKTMSKYSSDEEAIESAKEIVEELKAEYPAIISIPYEVEGNDYNDDFTIVWGNAEIQSPY